MKNKCVKLLKYIIVIIIVFLILAIALYYIVIPKLLELFLYFIAWLSSQGLY